MKPKTAKRILKRIGPHGGVPDQTVHQLYRWARKAPRHEVLRVISRPWKGKAYSHAQNCVAWCYVYGV